MSIRDLGIILDSHLNFKLQLDEFLLKANRTLGFILRFTSIFRDQSFLRNLYRALVRPLLEYANFIWNPPTIGWSRIENIQRLFTRIAFHRLLGAASLPSFETRLQLFNLHSLSFRRQVSQACFIGGLLLSATDAPDLLSSISLYVPSRSLRPRDPLSIETRHVLFILSMVLSYPVSGCLTTFLTKFGSK